MKILALESGDSACSVAILQDGAVLARSELAPRGQSLLLLPWVKALLAEAGLALGAFDAIAFGHGPGAFTGVRLATSVAQGLAFSNDLPVIGVSTLASMALQLHDRQPQAVGLLPVLDARMQEIYLGAYQPDVDGLVTALSEDRLCAPDHLPPLPLLPWLAGGSGLLYQQALGQHLELAGTEESIYPQAAAIARLAVRIRVQGGGQLAETAGPVYLRDQVIQGAVR